MVHCPWSIVGFYAGFIPRENGWTKKTAGKRDAAILSLRGTEAAAIVGGGGDEAIFWHEKETYGEW
jgi:hypothetical protein